MSSDSALARSILESNIKSFYDDELFDINKARTVWTYHKWLEQESKGLVILSIEYGRVVSKPVTPIIITPSPVVANNIFFRDDSNDDGLVFGSQKRFDRGWG